MGWSLSTAVAWLNPSTDAALLPVVPLFASGRLADLTVVRFSGTTVPSVSRLVLRLWTTDMELAGVAPKSLWVGSVTEERTYRPLSLITLVSTQPDFNAPRQTLAQSFDGGILMSRADEQTSADWDGRVLLAHQADTGATKP